MNFSIDKLLTCWQCDIVENKYNTLSFLIRIRSLVCPVQLKNNSYTKCSVYSVMEFIITISRNPIHNIYLYKIDK